MTSTRVLAMLALVAPLTAAAQLSYPLAADPVPRAYYRSDAMRDCNVRNDELWDRKSRLDAGQRDIDREGARLDRMKARLDVEYRNLDWGDDPAIRDYNARSAEYNQWVQAHNRRVARMNGEASVLNGDSVDLASDCAGIVVVR